MRLHEKAWVKRGFTLIELVVVISIISVLMAVALNRTVIYQEQAEKAAVEQLLGTLRSALHLQIADLLIKGKTNEISRLVEHNPMDWLAEKPANYAGEYYTPKPDMVEAGNWYFDAHDKTLVYLVHHQAHLHTAAGEANKLRFSARLVTSTPGSAGGGATESSRPSVEGVVLEPVVSYHWF
ncbi:MAG TPA: type II secretion system protein [Burkholderiaceae bacterium]|nr:type II secretion system protein [Burkholderiaceae bacterium]